jgi:hypothetical protein
MISWHIARSGYLDVLGVQQDLHQSTETSWTFFISQEVFQGKLMALYNFQKDRKYFIYYCSPHEVDRTVNCVDYWQPHRDGKCRTFPSTLIEKHSGLPGFAASKIATAYLLNALETQYYIAKEAVSVLQKLSFYPGGGH